MQPIYECDLAYVHAAAFEELARGATREIVRRLRGSSVEIRKVMDVGCGAGPLTEELVAAGFEVTGVDVSAELLGIARKRVPAAKFVHGSAYELEIAAFDAVIALGEPLTYHAEGDDAEKVIDGFFRRVAKALPPGGMLIFDVIGLGEPSLSGRTWQSGEDWAVMVETTERQAERRLVRSIEIFRRTGESYLRSREIHSVRLFDIQQLRDQLAFRGFAVEVAQAYGAQPLPPRRYAFFATRTGAKDNREVGPHL